MFHIRGRLPYSFLMVNAKMSAIRKLVLTWVNMLTMMRFLW